MTMRSPSAQSVCSVTTILVGHLFYSIFCIASVRSILYSI